MNNSIETFAFMTQGFRDMFSDLADFHIMEGPYEVLDSEAPPESALIAKGFKPPFRAWIHLKRDASAADLERIEALIKRETTPLVRSGMPEDGLSMDTVWIYEGIEKSCDLIAKEILEKGPFDGVLSFS